MPNQLKHRSYGYVIIALFLSLLAAVACLFVYEWVLGVIGFIIFVILLLLTVRAVKTFQNDLEQYVSTLSHRVKKVGDEVLLALPIGIVLYNEQYEIEWINRYIQDFLGEDSFLGQSLDRLSEKLIPLIKGEAEQEILTLHDRKFRVEFRREERLLYFSDVTELVQYQRLYRGDETVLGIIYVDNYEELTQGMDDQVRSHMNSEVTSILKQWATDHGIFLKRISSEKFSAVMNRNILDELTKSKFSVLDDVRETTAKENVPLTLSIGIGQGRVSLPELGQLAQSSLDLALGRGGDQVAIKQSDGKVTFHGGKTNPIEKRTRVRARVISHALRELVLAADNVMIMGHKNPDMDAIGAAIGILKVAEVNGKDGFIVHDKQRQGVGTERLIEEIERDDRLRPAFIPPDEAVEKTTQSSLLVVVDTHRPSLVVENRLLHKAKQTVVIDHHRRGEEFIEDPVLVYIEPYASSTAELVTELLEYQPSGLNMSTLEATSMLAGMIVDTKSFTLRTGSRTFDAASYLRARGADTIFVQRLLRDDLQRYIQRAKLIENAEVYRDGCAIATGHEEDRHDQVLIAQAADTLLSMNGVKASFVISKRNDGKTAISARSLGDMNVQVIMEGLGGGGHLTNAAVQLEDVGLAEAEAQLKAIIDQTVEEGEDE